jgi:predicted ATPase
MNINQVFIKNFKRFTNLLLSDIPLGTRLVLLIGTNGSGKSCIFDAFEYVASVTKEGGTGPSNSFYSDKIYYGKDTSLPTEVSIETDKGNFRSTFDPKSIGHRRDFSGPEPYPEKKFYGRSAVRFQARLEKTVIGTPISIDKDLDRPLYYIDRDLRFENDIDLLLMEVVQKVFSDLNNQTEGKIEEIKTFLKRINDGLSRIFNHSPVSQLKLVNFLTPADGKPAQLIFEKGKCQIHYDFLSSGEKEIINLLINLYTRSKFFTDSIYFMDEMDAHLNTTLQFQVIKEITEHWIPSGSQLWTASHSLGFIQYAKEEKSAVIFDFDDLDFDRPQHLIPESKDNAELYEIAVSKDILPILFAGFRIIFVENEDTRFYASLNIKNTLFIGELNRDSVYQKSKGAEYFGLIDRDYLTEEDLKIILEFYPNLSILRFYCIENYLYHPENLEVFYSSINKKFDINAYKAAIIREKNIVKEDISIRISSIRQSYPFFKEPNSLNKIQQKRFTPSEKNFTETKNIVEALQSDDFEIFYPYFSMKNYGKNIPERMQLNPVSLSKTNWFSSKIKSAIK